MNNYSHYEPFILLILTLPHHAPLSKRIRLTTVSMPSIFHAAAWRQYQGLSREYMNLTFLTESLGGKNAHH